MNDIQRDELLIELSTNVKHLIHVVDGNGNPGLVVDVATLKAEMDDIRGSVPSNKERKAGWIAMGIALLGTFGTLGAAMIGAVR